MTRKDFMAQLSSKTIPGGMWFLYGADRYTLRKAVALAREIPDDMARELNVSELEGPSLEELWSAVDALPFFSERRVVVAEKLDLDSARALKEKEARIPESTLLLIVTYGKPKKEWPEVFGKDRSVEFTAYNETELSDFFNECAKRNGLTAEAPAKREFLKRTGPDLAAVESYIRLLSTLPGEGKPITPKQVETYLPDVVEEKAWYIMDDFLAGDFRHGTASFENLYKDDAGSVFMILGYMIKRCGQMIEAKRLLAAKKTPAEIAGALGAKSTSLDSILKAAKRQSHARLAHILRSLVNFEHDLKQGYMSQHDAFYLALCKAFMEEEDDPK